jgi:hypothetical protein
MLAIAIAVAYAAPFAQADLYDSQTVLNNTGSAQSSLNLVFSGDIAGQIDRISNPFGPGGGVTYSYGSGQTTVTFTAGTPVANGDSATYGLSFTQNPSNGDAGFTILQGYWSGAESTGDLFPVLSISAAPMYVTGTVFYTEINFAPDDPADPEEESDPSEVYEELPLPGGCGEFTATNTQTETQNNISIYDTVDLGGGSLSTIDSAVGGDWDTWPVPLDELDQADTPVPGPWFWPVSDPDHTLLSDGEEADDSFSEDVYATPLPTPLAAGAALLVLIGLSATVNSRRSA